MRSALNENPMVQMGVLALMGVVFAFILFTSVLKKDDGGGSTTTTTDPAVATAATGSSVAPPATADPATGTVPPATATGSTGTTVPPATTAPSTSGGSDGLLASKGLPKDVLVAYAKGDAIALLVFKPKAKGSDKLVKYTEKGAGSNAKVFNVDVNDIAKYGRITQGVSVSQVPALVVISPRKVNAGAPMATVTYDLQSPQSIRQAIKDASYDGDTVPAYPSGDGKGKKDKKDKK